MFRFKLKYFIAFVLLLIVEILIALYIKGQIIRPYIGDVLVVILVYSFVKSFFNFHQTKTAVGVFIFAILVEISQYFKLISLLHLEDYQVAHWVLGNGFAWLDIVAYAIGTLIIIFVESSYKKINKNP